MPDVVAAAVVLAVFPLPLPMLNASTIKITKNIQITVSIVDGKLLFSLAGLG
jgi:hypothetical protein